MIVFYLSIICDFCFKVIHYEINLNYHKKLHSFLPVQFLKTVLTVNRLLNLYLNFKSMKHPFIQSQNLMTTKIIVWINLDSQFQVSITLINQNFNIIFH